MRTFPLRDADGRMAAFEIEMAYLGLRRLAGVLRGVDGVTAVRVYRRFERTGDVRVRFAYDGRECVVVEPFGDNSRYWLGPLEGHAAGFDAAPLEATLRAYRVPVLARLFGDLVSLRVPFLRSA